MTTHLSADLSAKADRHLWGHFARHGGDHPPIITRGEGVPHLGQHRQAPSAARPGCSPARSGTPQGSSPRPPPAGRDLEFFRCGPMPPSRRRAGREVGRYAPGDLNRIFTTGGGEAVESAWKLAKKYFKLKGKPGRFKADLPLIAYHGTPQGALAITGLPTFKIPFEAHHPRRLPRAEHQLVPRPEGHNSDIKEFGQWAASRIAEAIEFEGRIRWPRCSLEPVQNAGGCFPAAWVLRAGSARSVTSTTCCWSRRDHLRLRPDRLDVRLQRLQPCRRTSSPPRA